MARKAGKRPDGKSARALRLENLSRDQASLEASATFDEPPATGGLEGTARCYNSACPDYRRDRPLGEPCGCTRTSVAGPSKTFHLEGA